MGNSIKLCCVLVSLILFGSFDADAQINLRNIFNTEPGGWNLHPAKGRSTSAERSYQVLHEIRKGKLRGFDYYYQLKIIPQFKLTFETCNSNVTIGDVLEKIVGKTKQFLISVTLSIRRRKNNVSFESVFSNKQPILLAGRGADREGKASTGCLFEQIAEFRTPFFLRKIPSNLSSRLQDIDDFDLNYKVTVSTQLTLNAVEQMTGLFKELSGIVSEISQFSDIVGKRTELILKHKGTASRFEKALNSVGKKMNSFSGSDELETDGSTKSRFVITLPNVVHKDSGNIVIYTRLSASKIIDVLGELPSGPEIVFRSDALVSHHPKKTLRKKLSELLGTKAGGELIEVRLKDLDLDAKAQREQLAGKCKVLRRVLAEDMGLSTVDSLLLRRAVLQDSKIFGKVSSLEEIKALVAYTAADPAEIADACWNKQDAQLHSALSQKLTNKRE